jgi:hypothetical protein
MTRDSSWRALIEATIRQKGPLARKQLGDELKLTTDERRKLGLALDYVVKNAKHKWVQRVSVANVWVYSLVTNLNELPARGAAV